jgi:hypothetical protein
MNPLEIAMQYARTLPEKSPNRLVLELLVERGQERGDRRGVPWAEIEAYVRKAGASMTQNTFQQDLLTSRRNEHTDFYIGSCDHGEYAGYFIVQNDDDAEVMARWYIKRIQKESYHLSNLERLWPMVKNIKQSEGLA